MTVRRQALSLATLVGLILLGFVVGLAVLQIGTGYRPAGIMAAWHECPDCGGDYGSDYGHNRRDDRHRNRGAFSPGPFDDSPVDAFNGNTVCLPGSTCYTDDRRDQR